VVAANIVAVAAASAITYAVTKNSTSSTAAPSPSSTAPTYTPAEQDAAKSKVCHTFDSAVRGTGASDGLIVNGDLNIPVVLRKMNSVAAVQNSISSATPNDVAEAAKEYIQSAIDVSSAALAGRPASEVNRLTDVGNAATYALADACGLPH
jgi:hypothetical protein